MEKKEKNIMIGIISILIIPIQFILAKLIENMGFELGSASYVLIISIVSYVACFIMIVLNRDVLKKDFAKFKEKKWINILVAVLLVFLMHGILYVVRIPLKNLSGTEIEGVATLPLYITIISTLIPLTAPFVEELIFRYHLFGRFKNKVLKFIMFFISAILFGLIHYNNFNGDLVQLIPYIVMGMVFNLIYLFYKNIWNSIIVHLIFNGANVVLGVIGIVIVQFLK